MRTTAEALDGGACATPNTNTNTQQLRAKRRAQSRQSAELAALRFQAADLESHVALLRRFCGVGDRDDGRGGCTHNQEPKTCGSGVNAARAWCSLAAAELSARQQAEAQNRRLRAALDEQLRMREAIEQLLAHQLTPQDVAFLAEVEAQSALESDVAGEVRRTAVVAELLRGIERMYRSTAATVGRVFAARDTRRVFSSTHDEEHPLLGASHELTTNTPLPWDVHQVETFLWQQIVLTANVECGVDSYSHRHQHQHLHRLVRTSDDTHLSIAFDEVVGGRNLTGTFAIRKFVEPQRTVFVLAARIMFSGSALVIREDGWVVLTDLAPSGESNPRTLLQTHYRNYVERREEHAPLDLDELRDFVLSFQSERMRTNKLSMQRHMVRMQNILLSDRIGDLGLGCIRCEFEALQKERRAGSKTPLVSG